MSHLRLPAKPHDSTHIIAPLPRARSREPADKALLQKDAPAIPAASYTANVLRAGSWLPYAAANRDIATGIRAACTILVSIAILALLRMRRSENKKHQSEPA